MNMCTLHTNPRRRSRADRRSAPERAAAARRWLLPAATALLLLAACDQIIGLPDSSSPRDDAGSPPNDATTTTPEAGARDSGADADDVDATSADPDAIDLDWAAWPLRESNVCERDGDLARCPSTGLTWHATPSAPGFFADAEQHCEQSTLGGYDDWRLPRWIELVSLLDYSQPDQKIDRSVFTGIVPYTFFWSGSVGWEGGPLPGVEYSNGSMSFRADTFAEGLALCVRGPADARGTAPSARYEIDDETARDRKTGLRWERSLSNLVLLATETEAYCEARSTGGYDGWRTPTIQELLSLLDLKPTLGPRWYRPAFGAQHTRELWSSTQAGSDKVWTLDFATGLQSSSNGAAQGYPVRCVRDE